jgi:cytochrome c oxidase subunit 4
MMHKSETEHPSIRLITTVFVALLVLLIVTVGVAQVNLGRWNFVVAMAVASTKAALIVLYFMQVRYGKGLTWLFSVGTLFWFAVMIVLLFGDYLTRE